MSVDDQELRAIAFLAIRVRRATQGAGPWDEAGLMANLRKIQNRNLHMTVEHVLRHAADPNAKSPGVIVGEFTPQAPMPERARPPKSHEQCGRCGGFKGNCACMRESRALDYEAEPDADAMTRDAALTTARAAIAEGKARR